MMRRAALALALAPALASAELPRPDRAPLCRDALLLTAEHFDLAADAEGRGGVIDYLGCARGGSSFTLGGAAFSVADGRWRYGKAGGVLRVGESAWLAAEVKGGSGSNAAGAFDYLALTDSFTVRLAAPLYVRVEHQYLDIDRDRGHLARLAATFVPHPRVSIEVATTRSFDATFGTRQSSVRVDWLGEGWRLFAGAADGRSIPQVVDLATGARAPSSDTRQAYVGLVRALADHELGLLYDTQRTGAARRHTVTATVRWMLP